jgi:hypothetical protein
MRFVIPAQHWMKPQIYYIEESGLFGLFVCHVEISQITVLLAALLTYPWKIPQQVGFNGAIWKFLDLR